jgi:hypothetical protein
MGGGFEGDGGGELPVAGGGTLTGPPDGGDGGETMAARTVIVTVASPEVS